MKTWPKLLLKLVLTGLTLTVSLLVYADSDHDKAKRLHESGEILSLETVLSKVKQRHPGKVLEVELENKKGKTIYEIELLTPEGKVLELKYNAKSGQHISTEEED